VDTSSHTHGCLPMPDPQPHGRFHCKLWLRIFPVLFTCIFLIQAALAACAIVLLLSMPSHSKSHHVILLVFPLVFLFFMMIAFLVAAVFITVETTIPMFRGYLDISPAGIEWNFPPIRRGRCSWADLTHIKSIGILFPSAYLVYSHAEEWQPAWYTYLHIPHLPYLANSITLASFTGWPNGRLKELLEYYAPHLFKDEQ
jgi:hypothetical protein